ncbi:MAG: hypothetical protein HOP17_03475 [Acidobacteria bacterium]|nr:hypothetical protein [Acidobacteriota bacterium]
MKRALFIFLLAFVLMASHVFAQPEKINESDYNVAVMKALEAASARDRRIVTVEKFYTGEQVTGTRNIVSDFAGPDAKRINVTAEFGGKKTSNDAIQIGAEFFCHDAKNGWRKSAKECSKNAMMAIPDGEYEYFVETDAADSSRKIYTRRATFVDSGNPARDAVRLKFIEIKIVADDNGIIEYTETRRGGIDSNGWSSLQVTKYDYAVAGLKIADPTKEN